MKIQIIPPEFIVLAIRIVSPYAPIKFFSSTTTTDLQYSHLLIDVSNATNAYKNLSPSFLFKLTTKAI